MDPTFDTETNFQTTVRDYSIIPATVWISFYVIVCSVDIVLGVCSLRPFSLLWFSFVSKFSMQVTRAVAEIVKY